MKILLLVLVLFASLQARAEDYTEDCLNIADVAEIIMRYRQSDGNRTDFLDQLTKQGNQSILNLTIKTVNKAFLVPLYSAEQDRLNAMHNFKLESYRNCMAAYEQAEAHFRLQQ
jgi:hypothetical protein